MTDEDDVLMVQTQKDDPWDNLICCLDTNVHEFEEQSVIIIMEND